MKPHIKDILLLGGIYAAGSITLAYFSSFITEAAGLLWLAVCAAALVKLVWTKKLGLLAKFAKRQPRLAFFLTAIGWLPYAVTLFSFALFVAGTVITGELGRLALVNIYNLGGYVWISGLALSLGYAVYRVFYKKDYDGEGDAGCAGNSETV